MHERQTPSNLLAGRPWACWGPPVEHEHLTPAVVRRIARRVHRHINEVAAMLEDDQHRGRYLLLEQLSVTKHAAVYAGFDPLLARDVVVKIHRDQREHATAQALVESRAMAQLDQHPNIVRIYDVGEHIHHGSEGERVAWLYTVVERCDADLAAWHLGRDWAAITQRILEVTAGLDWLHQAGYAHGDIKPSNIFIRNGVAKLADFGHTAKAGTLSPSLGGTVGFVAPELFETGPTVAADVFALAVTLWFCLFDALPYPAPDGDDVSMRAAFAATLQRVVAYEIAEPKTLPPGLPAAVLRVLRDSLHPDARVRPSLNEFAGRLTLVIEREERRRRRRLVPAIAVVLLVVAGTGYSCGARSSARGEAEAGLILAVASNAGPLLGNPLAHAEVAAHRGDVDAAIGALYRLDGSIAELSREESFRAAQAAERIAEALDQQGHTREAVQSAYFAVRLYEGAARMQDSERLRKTFKIPFQNK
jgi:hypothetical protein